MIGSIKQQFPNASSSSSSSSLQQQQNTQSIVLPPSSPNSLLTFIGSNNDLNPLLLSHKLIKQVGSCGVEFVWKIFDAYKLQDGKECSLFLFEKKTAEKLHKPKRKEVVTDILKRDISNTTRIRCQHVIKVFEGLQETNESLAFTTEPVIGSLANLLGLFERKSAKVQQSVAQQTHQEDSFLELEIILGILQITKGLNFLHNVERLVHLNLCPQNIIITKKRLWKLSGLGFMQSYEGPSNVSGVKPWQSKQSKMAQPDLDFMSPEIQLMTSKWVNPSCDVFSLALLVVSIFNKGFSPLQANHNIHNYIKQLDSIQEKIESLCLKGLPDGWDGLLFKMINRDSRVRPTLSTIISMKCFTDPIITVLDLLENQDPAKRVECFVSLPHVISLIPTKLLYTSVLLTIKELMEVFENITYAVPSLISMSTFSTNEDYKSILQPEVKKIFFLQKPTQATVFLLENLDQLVLKATEEEVKEDILQFVFSSLDSNNLPSQEAALQVLSDLKDYIEVESLKTLIIPKCKLIFSKTSSVRTKINCLECLDECLESIEKLYIMEEVLPFLLEIQCSDADLIMTLVDIFDHMLCEKKLNLSHTQLASRVMPFVMPFAALPGLSIDQFSKLMEVLRAMLDEIERQKLCKMVDQIPDQVDLERRRSSLDIRIVDSTNLKHMMSLEDKVQTPPASIGASFKVSTINASLMNPNNPISSNHAATSPGTDRIKLNSGESCKDTLMDILLPPLSSSRRHSSYQGLEQKEQSALEVLYKQRLAKKQNPVTKIQNLLSPLTSYSSSRSRRNRKTSSNIPKRERRSSKYLNQPCILVSEPSINDFTSLKNQLLSSTGLGIPTSSRRPSASSMNSMNILQDLGSKKLSVSNFNTGRRSSFQGICDQAMQLFK